MTQTLFGQLVVGPPGSGKSTYCKFICENLKQLGRNAKIINLDPANDCLLYKPAVDITDLITVDRVMNEGKCGPNGALIHCIETLNKNYGWLYDKIVMLIESELKKIEEITSKREKEASEGEFEGKAIDCIKNTPYLLFDCPGQSEIYTHNTALRDITKKLTSNKGKHFDLRLVCMNLCDSYHASDLSKYIGIVMNSLSTMLNLELPHVNVLSKVDKIECYETELDSPFFKKYRELSKALVGVIEDFSLVSFVPLNIQKVEDIMIVLQMADKANGYLVDDLDLSILQMNPQLMELASGKRLESLTDATVQI